ncbi:uncharacterized protein [Nicotiana tomentosiformis]|uniref:uncharacterized protein n=1 Tax=Nicotiana tomentosiformis TaxID=4098 RepID=UPI00388CAEDC
MKKTPEEIVTILDELSVDANQWPSENAKRRRVNGVHQVDANISVQVQFDAMAKEIRKLTLASIQSENHAGCDICGRGHPTDECQASTEEVNVVGNYNFNATDERLDAHGAIIKKLGKGLQNLKKQVGQISTIFSERIPGTLPPDTERNPKDTVNVVTLRSGQIVKEPTPIQNEVVPKKESGEQLKNEVNKKKKGKKGTEEKKKGENSRRDESEESKHMPALPFPQNIYREKQDKQFERFMDMLKQVNVNLPFTKVLSQMPTHAKFLKEILTNNRKIQETSVVKLTEHCSAILQKKTPTKVKPESKIGEIRNWVKKKKKLAASVEWKLKSSKDKAAMSGKDKCGLYPKKAEKKLSVWMCALVWAHGMEPDFDSDPD